jgi:hypothetical protein
MKRIPVNPWSWSLNVGYHQAEILEGANRELICANLANNHGLCRVLGERGPK